MRSERVGTLTEYSLECYKWFRFSFVLVMVALYESHYFLMNYLIILMNYILAFFCLSLESYRRLYRSSLGRNPHDFTIIFTDLEIYFWILILISLKYYFFSIFKYRTALELRILIDRVIKIKVWSCHTNSLTWVNGLSILRTVECATTDQ